MLCISRRLRFPLVLFFLLYFLFPLLPSWTYDRLLRRPNPLIERSTTPNFLHHSRFRKDPHIALEAELEEAFLKIEQQELPEADMFVKKIWQVDLGRGGESKVRPDRELWKKRNPGWEYSLVTDAAALDLLLNTSLATIPSLLATWKSYPIPVMRADFLRYLLLWYYGGFYADLDTYPVCSIGSCASLIPLFSPQINVARPNISLTIGIEIDEPYASASMKKKWRWVRSCSFIQYTLFAPQRFSPILRAAAIRAITHWTRHNEAFMRWPRRYSADVVSEITGPGMFTDAVLDVLSASLPGHHALLAASKRADQQIGELGRHEWRVTWAPFHAIKEPVWVDATEATMVHGRRDDAMGGLLVLPINVWGNGQRHSGAELFDSSEACLNHRFEGTWKTNGGDLWLRLFG